MPQSNLNNLSRTPVKRGQQFVPRSAADRDNDGAPVPTWKPHTFTYDDLGKLITDTVMNGASVWVRTYQWDGDNQSADSGWVKQVDAP